MEGRWSVRRDEFGSAIDVENVQFEALTNILTTAYGEPVPYAPPNKRHGGTYLYHFSKAGISVFVSPTDYGAEVTLTKPFLSNEAAGAKLPGA